MNMIRETRTQTKNSVCAEGMGNGCTGLWGELVLSISLVPALYWALSMGYHLHLSPETWALLPPYTDEDLEAQRWGMTCPVSSSTKWLNLDLNPGFRLYSPPPQLQGCGKSCRCCLSTPLGSALRALYQQHPLDFLFSLLFHSLPPELNP